MIRIIKFGDWLAVRRLLKDLKDNIPKRFNSDLERIAQEAKLSAIKKIEKQLPSWQALSDATIEKKGHGHIYVDTGFYVENIETQIRYHRKRIVIEVSPADVIYDSEPFRNLRLVAAWMEYGTKRMPARPLWVHVGREMQAAINKLNRSGRYKRRVDKVDTAHGLDKILREFDANNP